MRPFDGTRHDSTSKTLISDARRVVDVEERVVGREADPVRHLELCPVDDQLEVSAARRDAKHALPAETAFPRVAEAGEAPVPRVREVDRAVEGDEHVVRRVELLAPRTPGR